VYADLSLNGIVKASLLHSTSGDTETVDIPKGKPEALGAGDMFNPSGVVFKGNKDNHQATYASPEQAALVAQLAEVGMSGRVDVPTSSSDCDRCLKQLQARLASAQERFAEVAALRTGTQSLQEKTAALLMQWYILGRNP
jgi:hypothetical protein